MRKKLAALTIALGLFVMQALPDKTTTNQAERVAGSVLRDL